MAALTKIQQQVFDFVRDRLTTGQSAPTLRELAEEFGWSSSRAAACHIEAIIRKGFLIADIGKARSLRLPNDIRPTQVAEIPIFGSIPAGSSAEREQDSEGCVVVTVESIGFKPTRNTFALRVVGDSMILKHICDGDIAVCEHGPEPRNGQVVAALIDRKNTLKTFIVKNGKPFLKAENPKYPNLVPSEELVIQGVLRAVIRRMKE